MASLNQRMYGYSFSEIEKEILFRQKDLGFVRPVSTEGTVFYLDPSPFLTTPKREVYVALCPPPPKGALVRVAVSETREEILKDHAGYYRLSIHCITSYEQVDPKTLIRRGSLLHPDEVIDFFTLPYYGEEEVVSGIAMCSALYAISSPPLPDRRGGISAAVLGKTRSWSGFKRSMDIIPSELRRESSEYYYRLSIREEDCSNLASREISLAFLNPEHVPMHIPLVLDAEVKNLSEYKETLLVQKPLVTAFMLDALLLQPVLPDNLQRTLVDTLYELVSDVKGSGSVPYNQDFSTLVPRLGASFARYSSRFDVSREDIRKGVDLWSDMFYRAKKIVSTRHPVAQLYRLSDAARRLYVNLNDTYGIENPIPVAEIPASVQGTKAPWAYEEALEDLNRQGLIIRMDRRTIKLLDFGKRCLT
jgi:hypothetical protein